MFKFFWCVLKTFFEARNEFAFKLFIDVDNMLCCPACSNRTIAR